MNEEWDIPWDDLDFDETDLIGKGRVGAVYKGRWHGEVAIRVIDICHSDEFKLRAFKHEVWNNIARFIRNHRFHPHYNYLGHAVQKNPP